MLADDHAEEEPVTTESAIIYDGSLHPMILWDKASRHNFTVFFFIERDRVKGKWKTSLTFTVAGLVTGIAFWHYMYMREVWVNTGASPTVFRYVEITVSFANQSFTAFYMWVVPSLSSLVMLIGGYPVRLAMRM